LLVGAAIGALSQLASDAVSSAIDGELSFSHWTSYVCAAAGGAVSRLIPNFYLSNMVDSCISTITSASLYNLESAIIGREEYYSFEEIAYTTMTDSMISIGFSFSKSQSKIMTKLKNGSKAEKIAGKVLDKASSVSVTGFKNSNAFPSLDSHTWKSPRVDRLRVFG